MNRNNDDLFDDKLQAIFDKRELKTETMVISLNNARKSSVGAKSVERKTVLEKIDLKVVGDRITCVALAAAVTLTIGLGVGAIVYAGGKAVNYVSDKISSVFDDSLSMERLSVKIGAFTDSKLQENGYARPILAQNTVHIEGNDYYYRHESIAKDLLRLDSRLFDYAFCNICDDMGPNRGNQVGPGGMSNIESVIFYLKQYSSDKDTESKVYVSEVLDGVSSLDDYLSKFGYVDKEGKPSLNEFRKVCDSNAEVIAAILQSNELSEGAKLS